MSKWQPISICELKKLIESGLSKMNNDHLKIWKKISIEPEKWIEYKYGKESGGFWTIAISENKIIWYNDIEEGFNISSFTNHGKIDEYESEQDELQWTMYKLNRHFK